MFLGQGIEDDLEKALHPPDRKSKKPLTQMQKDRIRREVFERWFNEKIERKFRDPMKG